MSFDLHISFTGLCLFVPDPGGTRLYVVLADPQAMGMDAHRASIFYDSGYDTDGGALEGDFNEVPASGQITLPSGAVAAGSGAIPKITPDIFALAHVADVAGAAYAGAEAPPEARKVDRQVQNPEDPRVAAIITIPGGRLLSFSASYPWYMPKSTTPVPLAWKVDWLIQGISNQTLTLGVGGAHGKAAESYELAPIGGVIELRVKNVLPAESMPNDPPYDPNAATRGNQHFEAFYKMLNGKPNAAVPHFGSPASGMSTLGSLIVCTPGTGQFGG